MASVAFPLLQAVPHFNLPPPFLFLELRGEKDRSSPFVPSLSVEGRWVVRLGRGVCTLMGSTRCPSKKKKITGMGGGSSLERPVVPKQPLYPNVSIQCPVAGFTGR